MTSSPVPSVESAVYRSDTRPQLNGVELAAQADSVTFDRYDLRRVSCKGGRFHKISFKYVIFEDCYFRDCEFDHCDFTGAFFRNSTLRGSRFNGCTFNYCRLSHTVIPENIIQRNMPGWENVALEFARALRVNYAQLGDPKGVNAAITAEIRANMTHLYKAAFSRESYYRDKHRGFDRVGMFFSYVWFRILNCVWGHGESVLKITGMVALLYVFLILFSLCYGHSFAAALADAHSIVWGTYRDGFVTPAVVAFATAIRYILLGLFITVLIRRFSRR